MPWITLLLSGFSVTAGAAVWPFQTHNQSPFSLIYGLPAPTAADIEAPGSVIVNWSVNISNVSIVQSAGNEFLIVDGETYQTDLTAVLGAAEGWALSVTLPFVAYSPGRLDGPIENYHDWFGLPQGNRLETPRDRLLFVYQRNGIERIHINRRQSAVGDLLLSAGRRIHSTENAAYSVWAGIKLPTGDSNELTGSGAADVSLWGAARKNLSEQWQLHGTAGLLFPGKGDILPELQEDTVFFGSMGAQWRHWRSIPLKAQLEWHTDFYEDSGIRFLGDVLQLTFGIGWEISPSLFFDFAIAEDIKEEASPDVNFHFALRVAYD